MAPSSRALLRLAVLTAVFVRSAGDAGEEVLLQQRLFELEKLVRTQQAALAQQGGRLAELEQRAPDEDRRLQVLPPSIHGAVTSVSRAYTSEESLGIAIKHVWLLLCGVLVLLMQIGFMFLQAARCSFADRGRVLAKNGLDICFSTLGWWSLGWPIAFGRSSSSDGQVVFGSPTSIKVSFFKDRTYYVGGFFGTGFLTTTGDSREEPSDRLVTWFFYWAVCLVMASIASSGVTERIHPAVYSIISLLMSGLIYPIVVASTWGGGWLSDLWDVMPTDVGGSGVVHLFAGVVALTATVVASRRPLRWQEPRFYEQNVAQLTMGTMLLWVGWYGLNCGLAAAVSDARSGFRVGLAAMTTTLGAVGGGLVAYALACLPKVGAAPDASAICFGILAGLVSISAGCANVSSGSALAIGAVGGLLYHFSHKLFRLLRVDDVAEAGSVHAVCGLWGLLAASLFDWGMFDNYYGTNGFDCVRKAENSCAVSWSDGFLTNLVEIAFVSQWAFLCSLVLFLILRLTRALRPDHADLAGLLADQAVACQHQAMLDDSSGVFSGGDSPDQQAHHGERTHDAGASLAGVGADMSGGLSVGLALPEVARALEAYGIRMSPRNSESMFKV